MIHFATNARATACGASTDYAVHTDEPELVDCQECLAAAAPVACPGGCGSAAQDCSCFHAGWDAAMVALGMV